MLDYYDGRAGSIFNAVRYTKIINSIRLLHLKAVSLVRVGVYPDVRFYALDERNS